MAGRRQCAAGSQGWGHGVDWIAAPALRSTCHATMLTRKMQSGLQTGLAPLDRLVAQLAADPAVERIWLFGSRARGDQASRSDIDLAVEAPRATTSEWLALCDIAANADTLLPVDFVRLDEASPSLRERVLAEGRLLHER